MKKMSAIGVAAGVGLAVLAVGCASEGGNSTPAYAPGSAEACVALKGTADAARAPDGSMMAVVVTAATFNQAVGATAVSAAVPPHCELNGTINARTSAIDGQRYAIAFHVRLPESREWNGRFFMQGGGGTNGDLGNAMGPIGGAAQPETALTRGFAVISTDSGHDNKTNAVPTAGGNAAFGRDPQARTEFFYAAYDVVTQSGKRFVERYYGKPADKSYFLGCSEGGREAAMMAQRYPTYYDGIVGGAMAFAPTKSVLATAQAIQRLGADAQVQGLIDAKGIPQIHKLYTDADLQLASNAILAACDGIDGLVDGIVGKPWACTNAEVYPQLAATTCSGAKNSSCLSSSQVSVLKDVYAGPINSSGQQLYTDWQWDPGLAGTAAGVVNQGWRSWYLGAYAPASSNSIKLGVSLTLLYMLAETPSQPYDISMSAQKALAYNWKVKEPDSVVNFPASGIFKDSPGEVYNSLSTDLSVYKARGGKFLVYHGVADPAVPYSFNLKWFQDMAARTGAVDTFAKFYPVPGMNHCSGGPATDRFDLLTAVVNWTEKGIEPGAVVASATTPGYFNAAARSRPLCPYPKVPTYAGSGDINVASSFTCQ